MFRIFTFRMLLVSGQMHYNTIVPTSFCAWEHFINAHVGQWECNEKNHSRTSNKRYVQMAIKEMDLPHQTFTAHRTVRSLSCNSLSLLHIYTLTLSFAFSLWFAWHLLRNEYKKEKTTTECVVFNKFSLKRKAVLCVRTGPLSRTKKPQTLIPRATSYRSLSHSQLDAHTSLFIVVETHKSDEKRVTQIGRRSVCIFNVYIYFIEIDPHTNVHIHKRTASVRETERASERANGTHTHDLLEPLVACSCALDRYRELIFQFWEHRRSRQIFALACTFSIAE